MCFPLHAKWIALTHISNFRKYSAENFNNHDFRSYQKLTVSFRSSRYCPLPSAKRMSISYSRIFRCRRNSAIPTDSLCRQRDRQLDPSIIHASDTNLTYFIGKQNRKTKLSFWRTHWYAQKWRPECKRWLHPRYQINKEIIINRRVWKQNI